MLSEGEKIKPWRDDTYGARAALQAIEKQVAAAVGLNVAVIDHLRRIKHVVTRYKITLDCVAAKVKNLATNESRSAKSLRSMRASDPQLQFDKTRYTEVRWVELDELEEYPFSTTGRTIVEELLN